MEKECVNCGKKYMAIRYAQKYCSAGCNHFQKGHQAWNKDKEGNYFSDEVIKKATDRITSYIKNETQEQRDKRLQGLRNSPQSRGMTGKIGEICPHWLGDKANYNSKHRWIQIHWTKTGKCEHCGEVKVPREGTRLKVATYWHNPTKTYRRERTEWMEVCAKCHYKLDKKS